MKQTVFVYIPAILFLLACVLILFVGEPIDIVQTYLSGMNMFSYAAYVVILIVAVVFMPLTVMPVIPLASAMLGPFATAVLSIIGWTLGSTIAFLIARYLGKPIVGKFVSLQKLDETLALIPEKRRFWFVVLLRMTLPVDIVSYALGLTSIRFWEYTAATCIGVIWFSFAFAYLGDALLSGNTLVLIELGGASLLVFILGWYVLRRSKK